LKIIYRRDSNALDLSRTRRPIALVNGTIRLRNVVDRTDQLSVAPSFALSPNRVHPMARFREVAEKLWTLSNELKNCTDPTKDKRLICLGSSALC
jgi:hypothetical protein